jgi:hypothetical protein
MAAMLRAAAPYCPVRRWIIPAVYVNPADTLHILSDP